MAFFIAFRKFFKLAVLMLASSQISSCYFVNFFKKQESEAAQSSAASLGPVLGQSLGSRAGSVDEAALEALYAITSSIPPAPIRADPDMYARRLLLQYRAEGSTVAREIGEMEGYRLLLGGASADFQKKPQEGFDATSLLANLTVAEQICTGLVAPSPQEYESWESILPAAPDDWYSNIRFLAQRFIGKPSSNIDDSIISSLKEILDSYNESGSYSYEDYIPVCTTLALDAEALLL